MRPGRLKQIKKALKVLSKEGYSQPYNILAEKDFLVAFNNAQLKISHLEQLLGGTVRVFTPLCEYKRYKQAVKDVKLIQHVRIKMCGHTDPYQITTIECLKQQVEEKNPDRYFLAVSKKTSAIKESKKVPIILFKSGVLCIETKHTEKSKKEAPQKMTEEEKENLEKMFG